MSGVSVSYHRLPFAISPFRSDCRFFCQITECYIISIIWSLSSAFVLGDKLSRPRIGNSYGPYVVARPPKFHYPNA